MEIEKQRAGKGKGEGKRMDLIVMPLFEITGN